MGHLIVFEGIDGSGKSTQAAMLCARFEAEGRDFRRVTFPQYSEPSSALIKMYLAGDFGEDPEAVNPYAASTFFAADRFASYVQNWRGYYLGGGTVLTDRYTTSNALHQGAKLSLKDREKFFGWLYDFEFRLMELPKPDIVIYLDIPLEAAETRMRMREAATGTNADIHERDSAYLKKCLACGTQAAGYLGWHRIDCFAGGTARGVEDIHEEIYHTIMEKELS